MEVILLQDIKGLGKVGDTVKAKDGYARNYLIPKKLAQSYAPGAVKALEEKRKKEERGLEKEKEKAIELAKTISKLSLTIPMEAGANDTLFGSVTPDRIFHALREEGLNLDKKSIILKDPIRKLGIYNAEVSLHSEIKENLRIWVVKK